jgi:hypothetical protein
MKITKAKLKQIIKEELDNITGDEQEKINFDSYGVDIMKGGISVPRKVTKEFLDLVMSLLPEDFDEKERKNMFNRFKTMPYYSQASLHKELKKLDALGKKEDALTLIYKEFGIAKAFAHKMSSGGYGRLD